MNFGRNVGEWPAEVKQSRGFLLQARALSCQQRGGNRGMNAGKLPRILVLALLLAAFPEPASANVVWPAAILIMTAGIAFASLDIVRDPIYGRVSPGLLPN